MGNLVRADVGEDPELSAEDDPDGGEDDGSYGEDEEEEDEETHAEVEDALLEPDGGEREEAHEDDRERDEEGDDDGSPSHGLLVRPAVETLAVVGELLRSARDELEEARETRAARTTGAGLLVHALGAHEEAAAKHLLADGRHLRDAVRVRGILGGGNARDLRRELVEHLGHLVEDAIQVLAAEVVHAVRPGGGGETSAASLGTLRPAKDVRERAGRLVHRLFRENTLRLFLGNRHRDRVTERGERPWQIARPRPRLGAIGV